MAKIYAEPLQKGDFREHEAHADQGEVKAAGNCERHGTLLSGTPERHQDRGDDRDDGDKEDQHEHGRRQQIASYHAAVEVLMEQSHHYCGNVKETKLVEEKRPIVG